MVVWLRCHFGLGSRLTTVARGAPLPTRGNATTPADRIGLLLVARLAVVGAGRVLGRVAELTLARRCALPRPTAEARKRRLIIRPLAYSSARMHEPLIINNLRAKHYRDSEIRRPETL
jgi:hypothetical protein